VILLIVCYVLKLISKTRKITDNLILFIIRICPFFSFPFGMLMVG